MPSRRRPAALSVIALTALIGAFVMPRARGDDATGRARVRSENVGASAKMRLQFNGSEVPETTPVHASLIDHIDAGVHGRVASGHDERTSDALSQTLDIESTRTRSDRRTRQDGRGAEHGFADMFTPHADRFAHQRENVGAALTPMSSASSGAGGDDGNPIPAASRGAGCHGQAAGRSAR